MLSLTIPSFFLFLFGTFNLFGIRQSFINTQIIFFLIALVVYFLVKKIGWEFFRINTKFFYWFFIIFLVLTYLVGLEAHGSKRWINAFFFNIQPSEFFKIFYILFFADYFSHARKSYNRLSFYLYSLGYMLLPTLIIFKQPDLASALVYFTIYFVMCFFSQIPKKYILFTIIIGLLIAPLSSQSFMKYQRDRIVSFFNPHIDQKGTSYNMTQAIITVGSGQFIGRGLGLGTQTQLYFLPENHTDFAFSSLVEQFGFIGGLAVIGLYVFISLVLVKKILHFYYQRSEENTVKFFFTIGFLTFLIVQVFVNIGMNLGLLPVAGIALPLISYGGSSLVTWAVGLALLP